MTACRAIVAGLNHYHVTGWVESLARFDDRLEIVGRYDPDPARARAERPEHIDPSLPTHFPPGFGDLPFSTDLGRLIADERPDLALVTLPNALAPGVIAHLAGAGVHLLVDKPGARTATELARAMASVRASGVKMAVAFTRRYGRPWQDAALAIQIGRLGRLLTAEAIFVTSSVRVRDPANPLFSRESMGGGVLHWLGVHDIDLLHWLSGEPIVEVQAMTANSIGAPIDVEDAVSAAFRFAGGGLGTMHFAYALPRPAGEGYLALRGSAASLRLDVTGASTWIGPGDARDPTLVQTGSFEPARSSGYGWAGSRIIDDLLEAIEQDRQPFATGEHALAALQVIDAIYESARSGRRVKVTPVEGGKG